MTTVPTTTDHYGLARVTCPRCGADPGAACVKITSRSTERPPHRSRESLAAERIAWVSGPDGAPVSTVVSVSADWTVTIRCPLCSGTHVHGWLPDMLYRATPRVAHCGHGDYWIPACAAEAVGK